MLRTWLLVVVPASSHTHGWQPAGQPVRQAGGAGACGVARGAMRSLASISHLRKNSSHASPRVWSSSRSSVAQRGGGEVSGVLMRNGVVLAAILCEGPG